MNLPLQPAVLLALGALGSTAAYLASGVATIAVISASNVLLIWASLHIATGGSPQPAELGAAA